MAPLDPFLGLYTVITRQDTMGVPVGGWHPEERLTIQEAMDAFTLGGAYAESMDGEKGSLEPGKLADIVIVDANLLEASPGEIRRAQVLYTIVGGEIVYTREP